MQYNGESTNQDLCTLLDDLTGQNDTIFPLEEKTRHLNSSLKTIWSWIHEAYGGWQYDDSNSTDLPSATTALVSGQQDYTIPSDSLVVRGFDILLNGSTVWQQLRPLTEEQIRDIMSEKQFMSTNSQPAYYNLVGSSVKLYPAPNYSLSAALRVTYERGSSIFSSTDTTKSPGFASEFHEAIAYGAASIYGAYRDLKQTDRIELKWRDYEKRIKKYYQDRYHQLFPPRVTVFDAVRENQ